MESTARFARLVALDGAELSQHLAEAALLVAAHANPGLEIERYLRRLDEIASACAEPRLADVTHTVFEVFGFAGNRGSYYDPRNSLLDRVLDRRLGIPITLGIVLIEVAKRVGVDLAGVNLPGHFVVRLLGDIPVFLDPFEGGRLMSEADCEARFRQTHPGFDGPFDPAYLEPASGHAVIARMLANLQRIYRTRHQSQDLDWVLRLREMLPGVSLEARAERAQVLASLARFDEAAMILDALAEHAPENRGAAFRARASRLRARLN